MAILKTEVGFWIGVVLAVVAIVGWTCVYYELRDERRSKEARKLIKSALGQMSMGRSPVSVGAELLMHARQANCEREVHELWGPEEKELEHGKEHAR